MRNILKKYRSDPFIISLILLTVVGLFLRIYKLDAFVTFLGDQGRDAIILKRIVMFEHFPAVGAPSSVGQIYLGPFYYYFIAPWLLLFNFNPIGPAYGVALFSTLLIPVVYYIVADLLNKKAALVTSVLVTFSGVLVTLSRYSWNPNLLPLFSIVAIYTLIKAIKTGKWWYFVLSGAFFSFCIQLHYVSLAAGLPVICAFGYYVYAHKKNLSQALTNIGYMCLSFLIFTSPLILFDLKHNFINLSGFVHLFSESQAVSSSRGIGEIFYTFYQFNLFAVRLDIPEMFYTGILLALLLAIMQKNIRKSMYGILCGVFISVLIVTAYFTGNKYYHYFGFLYILYYILLAYLASYFLWNKRLVTLLIILLFGFVFLQQPRYSFLWHSGSHQIERAETIAKEIFNEISAKEYQIGSLPEAYGDSTQRYYLELWGKRPLDRDAAAKGDELFILCEKDCWPIGSSQWNIAYFAPTKVVRQWKVEDVTIYKLTR